MSRWIVAYDNYDCAEKAGVNFIYREISSRVGYVLPVKFFLALTEKDKTENSIVFVCTSDKNADTARFFADLQPVPDKDEGYSISVGKSAFSADRQMIVIAGKDDRGALYGCVDLVKEYIGARVDIDFDSTLPEWKKRAFPKIKTRAVWTWGHVIYDYRGFFENMAKLKMNEIVIWNDVAPLNADEVVGYAHSLGIKVIWGFAWGWTTKCREAIENLDNASLLSLKKQIISTYENEYASINGDGIYFQSFTELGSEIVDGKCVAEIVTELVNDVSGTLLKKYPSLEIQFGLHATSVAERLDIIKKVDSRVRIVWEDQGAFPFSYDAEKVENYEKTLDFVKKTAVLRGVNERFGAVIKGMLNLDWTTFEHFASPFLLGEKSADFIARRADEKREKWRAATLSWQKNAEYARRMIDEISTLDSDAVIEALIEDAMLEHEICFPAALLSEILWSPDENIDLLIEKARKNPFVKV